MATGGMGCLVPVAVVLVGIVSILRGRRAKRAGKEVDPVDEDRQASAAEVQRRMAAYLASRNSDN
jgi:hypothetical protein